MKSVLNTVRSVIAVLTGIAIILLAFALTFLWNHLLKFLLENGVNASDLAWMNHFVYPGGQILFPLLGVFVIVWAVGMSLKMSWARIVGIALSVLGVFALLAIAILIIPFWSTALIMRLRWWILIIWLLLLAALIYQVYLLAFDRETEESYAVQYFGRQVVATCDRCESKLDPQGRCPRCDAPAAASAPAGGEGGQAAGAAPPAKPSADTPTPPPPPRARDKARVLARLVGESSSYELRKERTTIGRLPENDLVLEDGSVSKHHAVITYSLGKFTVEDVGSTNGTLVNGTKIETAAPLESGAHIDFGRIRLTFEIIM